MNEQDLIQAVFIAYISYMNYEDWVVKMLKNFNIGYTLNQSNLFQNWVLHDTGPLMQCNFWRKAKISDSKDAGVGGHEY